MAETTQETTHVERTEEDDRSAISYPPQKKICTRRNDEPSLQEHFDGPMKQPDGCQTRLHAKVATLSGELKKHSKKEPAKATTEALANAREKNNPQGDHILTEDESDGMLVDIPSDQQHFAPKEPIDDGTNPHWSRAMRTVQICMREASNLPGRPIKCTFSEHPIHRYGSFKWGHEIYRSLDNQDLHVHYIRNCREQGFPYVARNEHRHVFKYFWPNEAQTQENVLLSLNLDATNRSAGAPRMWL